MIETVCSLPSRTIVTAAGVVALQPSTLPSAHVCVATWSRRTSGSPRLPSTATTRSPTCSTFAAAPLVASASTSLVGVLTGVPQISRYAVSRISASAMLTAGPAPITNTRFQTGWRK